MSPCRIRFRWTRRRPAARPGFVACLPAGLIAGLRRLQSAARCRRRDAGLIAEQLYQQAHDALIEGNYTRAIKLFESLEARFPYGRYAQQAISSRLRELSGRRDGGGRRGRDRFIRTFPNHPNVDYAFYLKGLVHFREDQGLLGYVYELDLSEREPKGMRESFAAFKEL